MPTRKIYVRVGGAGVPVGELLFDAEPGGRQTSTFTYADSWLKHRNRFDLAPHRLLGSAPFYANKATDEWRAIGRSQ